MIDAATPRHICPCGCRLFRLASALGPTLGDGPLARSIRALAAGVQPGDELWHNDSDPEDRQHLCGGMGFAVVRDGQVVASAMPLMN